MRDANTIQSVDVVTTSLLAQLPKADSCQRKKANPDSKAKASQVRVEGLSDAQTNLLQRSLAACELLPDEVSCEAKHGLHSTTRQNGSLMSRTVCEAPFRFCYGPHLAAPHVLLTHHKRHTVKSEQRRDAAMRTKQQLHAATHDTHHSANCHMTLTTLPTVSSFCLEKPNPPLSMPRVPAGSCAKLTLPGFCTPPARNGGRGSGGYNGATEAHIVLEDHNACGGDTQVEVETCQQVNGQAHTVRPPSEGADVALQDAAGAPQGYMLCWYRPRRCAHQRLLATDHMAQHGTQQALH